MMTCPAEFKEGSRAGNGVRARSRRAAMRTRPIAAAVVAVILGLIAPLSAEAAENAVTVEIANFTYVPAVVTVTPGTTVTWINHDDSPHTVTATQKAFRSNALDTDDSFTFTFAAPGDYAYFCMLHPHMTGRVIVRPAAR